MLLEGSEQSPRLLASEDQPQVSKFLVHPRLSLLSHLKEHVTAKWEPLFLARVTEGMKHMTTMLFYQSRIWHEPSLDRLAFKSIIGWASPPKVRTLNPSKPETFWVVAVYSKWKLQIWCHVINFNQNTGTKTVFTLGVCSRLRTEVSFMLRLGSGA